DFVKGVLFHMIADYHRRRRRSPQALSPDAYEPAVTAAENEADQQFVESWRAELLDRAWKALLLHQEQAGQPFHTVLRFRAEHPDLRSPQMAEQLTSKLGKSVTAVPVRHMLHRDREQFAAPPVDELAQPAQNPTTGGTEQDPINL